MSYSHLDTDTLLRQAAADAPGAQDELVRRYLPRLTAYCSLFATAAQDKHDLAQTIVLHICRQCRTWQGDGSAEAWLFQIARHHCLKGIEQRGRDARKLRLVADAAPLPVESSLETLAHREQHERLRELLQQLPLDERDLIFFRMDQELDYTAIAAITGESATALRKKMSRVLDKLRKIF